MLRSGAHPKERRRELRWAKARAASQLKDIYGRSLGYKSAVRDLETQDATGHCRYGAMDRAEASTSQAFPSTSQTVPSSQGVSPCVGGPPLVDEGTSSEDSAPDESQDDSFDGTDEPRCLSHRLRGWAVRHNIPHSALNDLLPMLKEKDPEIPSDARTLLMTPRECPIRPLSNGEYVHFGLKPGLARCLSSGLLTPDADTLHLTVNIDGLPLFHNSSQQVWPILAMVSETKDGGPFPVGVFSATKKPQDLAEYLEQFVADMDELQSDGFECLGQKWPVAVRAIVCDYPARVFVKSTKGHTAYYGCDKCTQKGVWQHRMTFPEMKAPVRTDAAFIAQQQEGHHTGVSPFSQLGIGMVSQFPIDYMHLVLLGVVRKFAKYWTSGPFSVRRSSSQVEAISTKIALLRPHTPCDFSRRLRSLQYRERWKATEARLFLLYASPVVLKGILTDESFNHFMTLHVAIRILCTKDCPEHLIAYAEQLLHFFVDKAASATLYGEAVHVYNVHALIHIANDVRAFGPLDSFSSFPFENYLGSLKRKVRTGNRPLAQLYKRMKENLACTRTGTQVIEGTVYREHTEGPVPPAFVNATQFTEVICHGQSLKTTQGDNCILLSNNSVAIVENILTYERQVNVVGMLFRTVEDLYSYPCRSSLLGVVMVGSPSPHNFLCKLSDVKAKCFPYPSGSTYACFPILHSKDH
ncbi:unnamed protein product [Ixodes persulcatus]